MDAKEKDSLDEDFLGFDQVPENAFQATENTQSVAAVRKVNNDEDSSDLESRIAKKFDKNRFPWLSKRTLKIKDIFLFLHSEIIDFVEFLSQTELEKQRRQEVVDRIRKVVHKIYPEAKVLIFGSCATGINLPKSDIDLLVYYPVVREITMINRITSELVRADICASIEPIKHAKVPIIKLKDKQTSINVDISFNRENGIYCVKLVK